MFNIAEVILASKIGAPKKQHPRGFRSYLSVGPLDDKGHRRGHWINPSRSYPYSSERQDERNARRYAVSIPQ